MNLKKIIASVLACATLFSASVFGETSDIASAVVSDSVTENAENAVEKEPYFSDVPADSEYAEAVNKMVEYGIINGYEDKTFRPENSVTRAEMCKMINLTFNYTAYDKAAGFPDVLSTKWYYVYALAAQQEGYVKGYEDGSFRGENNITRQEVCAIIERIIKPMDLSEYGTTVEISDEVAEWAKKSVELVVMNGLMPLEENNTFRAKENIKRYELAVLLSKFVVKPAEALTGNVRFFNGETQIGETETVLIGAYPNVPEAPTPEDVSYEFVGWRIVGQSEIVNAKSSMILTDTDYEAVFAKKTFTVEFLDGSNVHESQTVEYGKSPTEPKTQPQTDGYEFKGWAYDEDGAVVGLETITITSDTKLHAVYKKESSGGGGGGGGGGASEKKTYYTVLFFVDDEIYENQNVLKGSKPKKTADPFVEDKVFLGWSKKENGDENDVVDVTKCVINEATDFYAVFKDNPNDSEMIEMLEKGISQLKDKKGNSIGNTKSQKEASKRISNCMENVLLDAKNGIYIDREYISHEYGKEVDYVKDEIFSSKDEASAYYNFLLNEVDKDVREFLMEYFLDGEDNELK